MIGFECANSFPSQLHTQRNPVPSGVMPPASRRPEARVLMFSMYQDGIYVTRAISAGACGYLSKASAPDLLVGSGRLRRRVPSGVLHVAGGPEGPYTVLGAAPHWIYDRSIDA
jgi:hypothetical protein